MIKYCEQDVLRIERIYLKLRGMWEKDIQI